ncbi:MAG: S41 family peptidase [bacterium]
MNSDWKKISSILVSLVIIGAAFGVGVGVGVNSRPEIEKVVEIKNKETLATTQTDFAPFWTTWNLINQKYVNSGMGTATQASATSSLVKKMPTDQDKVWGAISGLVGSLNDPYSVFMPPEQAKSFSSQISGTFEGVGMELGIKDGVITVIAPLEGTPAKRAGIKAGDKVVSINGKTSMGMGVEDAILLIRGKKGTEVALSIAREGEEAPLEIKIIRDVIDMPTIQLGNGKTKDGKVVLGNNTGDGLRDDGTFVIRLFNFSANSAELFREALKKFISSGSNKLILDLRGNPGGYLEAAVDMASWFLPADKLIVKESFGKNSNIGDKIHMSKGYNVFNDKLKMVILIDRGSASASEILAGALNEHKVATLIGEKSFGKGSVQELVPITEDTFLKITVAKWLTPGGHSISDFGLTPSITVAVTKEDVKAGKDAQLERAAEFLVKGK